MQMHTPAHVKNGMCHFYDTYCLGHWNEENERTETSNWMADHFSLIFINLSLAQMSHFLLWLQNKGKFLSLKWTL